MADVRIQRPALPSPLARYDQDNEAAFRREVETLYHEVDAAILSFSDTHTHPQYGLLAGNPNVWTGRNYIHRVTGAAGWGTRTTGDSDDRWRSKTDGKIEWGDGTGTFDAAISRSAAGVLDVTADFNLTRTTDHATITLVRNANFEGSLVGKSGSNLRWELLIPTGELETGSDAGSNLKIIRWNDGGTVENDALTIQRSDGQVWMGLLRVGGSFASPDLEITDIGTQDPELEAPGGSMYLKTLGSTTATGDGLYIDDGGDNKAKIASVKAVTSDTATPTNDYPWGCLHLIY